MQKVTLRQSAKEAVLATVALVLLFAVAVAVLWVAACLAAGNHFALAILWLLAVVFGVLTAGRWLWDRV